MDLAERMEQKTDKRGECWLWTAGRNACGYGIVWDPAAGTNGTMRLAHRVAYELEFGPIPKGKELDHLCRTRHCVRPAHLEPVTHRENVRRGEVALISTSKTHCPQGHAYDEANTYRHGGKRHCRACSRDAQKRYRLRKVAA